jgi:hypothetical protein
MENWKVFYSNNRTKYEISDTGLVRNATTKHIWKLGKNTCGYSTIKINGNWFLIHRLVGLYFLDNLNQYPNVCHEDNNPSNNSVHNLYWGTQSMNILQCVTDGNHKRQNKWTK